MLQQIVGWNDRQCAYQLSRVVHRALEMHTMMFRPVDGHFSYDQYHDVMKALPKEQYSFEYAKQVRIEDVHGLEMLLEKTRQNEVLEWGTVFNVFDDHGVPVVHQIVDPEEAVQRGIVIGRSSGSILFSNVAMKPYGGYQHYHPNHSKFLQFCCGFHYRVSFVDRCKFPNWINLLTFNLPEGPEMIAFNRKFTYVPTNASKTVFVRATASQIMEYLRK